MSRKFSKIFTTSIFYFSRTINFITAKTIVIIVIIVSCRAPLVSLVMLPTLLALLRLNHQVFVSR